MNRTTNMRKALLLTTFALILASAGAMSSGPDTIRIKTSSQCEMCKERIEEALAFERGVKNSELDLETQIVKVNYNPEKTSPEKIRRAISKTGYDADHVPADPKAYSKLPVCCRKPDDPESMPH